MASMASKPPVDPRLIQALITPGTPGANISIDPETLMRMGGGASAVDPDAMGQVRQAGVSDNGLRSIWTGSNPDNPQWVNDLAGGMSTALMTGGPMLGMIKAYHGSPYDFDAFDMSKIGTGEGAQSYGHGLYFAENPEVAKSYKETLAKKRNQRPVTIPPTNDGNPFQGGEILEPDPTRPGKTYEVGIDAHPDEFLDWDKPLSEQSPQVQDALKNVPFVEPDMLRHMERNPQVPARVAVSTPEQAEALRAAGIKGIRYADEGSRNLDRDKAAGPANLAWEQSQLAYFQRALAKMPGDPTILHNIEASKQHIASLQALPDKQATYNYVVFDDKTISILKKYGIAGLVAGSAAAATAQPSVRDSINQAMAEHKT